MSIAIIRKINSFLTSFIYLLVFSLSSHLPLQLAYAQTTNFILITAPNGGESYTVGDPVHITWNTDSTNACSIYYVTQATGINIA